LNKRFEYYYGFGDVHCKYALGAVGVKGREFHSYHEVLLFLGGSARFASRDINRELKVGSLVVIPKESFHTFTVTGDDYKRLILGFGESPELSWLTGETMREVEIIEKPHAVLSSLLSGIADTAKSGLPNEVKAQYFRSAVVQLLACLKLYPRGEETKSTVPSPTVCAAMDLIDLRYRERLTVGDIAAQLHVSPSSLSHSFSAELGVSVYRYITGKRLSVARRLISEGRSKTEAALAAGFADYSSFYRLYKKNDPEGKDF